VHDIIIAVTFVVAFSALALLVGPQEESTRPVKIE